MVPSFLKIKIFAIHVKYSGSVTNGLSQLGSIGTSFVCFVFKKSENYFLLIIL